MIVSHYPPTLYLGRTYRVTFADITEEKAEEQVNRNEGRARK
jgi:hypothetical protein